MITGNRSPSPSAIFANFEPADLLLWRGNRHLTVRKLRHHIQGISRLQRKISTKTLYRFTYKRCKNVVLLRLVIAAAVSVAHTKSIRLNICCMLSTYNSRLKTQLYIMLDEALFLGFCIYTAACGRRVLVHKQKRATI
jgi:hypothetical protein